MQLDSQDRNYARRSSNILHDVARKERTIRDPSDFILGFKTRGERELYRCSEFVLTWSDLLPCSPKASLSWPGSAECVLTHLFSSNPAVPDVFSVTRDAQGKPGCATRQFMGKWH